MTTPEQAALRAQRSALALRLAQGLGEATPVAELKDLQTRLQLIDGVLADAAPPGHALRRHLIALLLVAAAVSLAALLPMPRVSFVLELDAGAAQMRMIKSGNLAGQPLDGEMRAEGFSRIESADPALAQRALDGGASQLALQAQRLNLRRISFPAGARIDFEAGAQTVRVAIDGTAHAAEFEIGGQASSSFGGSPREAGNYAVAEWLKLVAGTAPTELWFTRKPERSYLWRGLQPDSLRLVERQSGADAQVRLVSALRQGLLRLPATGRELRLIAGSGLELDGLQLDQADLTLGEQVGLRLSGSAQRMVLETGGFQQSLKPSLLDYVAHNHGLGLIWSAAGLLWGISTWLRKALGDKF
ncbi:hypothetical protein [Rhodoferax sp. UBA5149]|uniref:hypothetical protein n=1 Tax=Rhodoferax sp. UBA5149 TaxID=1947379 RepID=UPI0025F8103E|nr:hypothetical protein [Rhodoferax sp. UBA5149]